MEEMANGGSHSELIFEISGSFAIDFHGTKAISLQLHQILFLYVVRWHQSIPANFLFVLFKTKACAPCRYIAAGKSVLVVI